MVNRSAAPGRLEVVRSFVNTLDVDAASETLGTPDDLRRWLRAASLLDEESAVTATDVGRALELREALRAVLVANHSAGPVAPGAVAVINEAAERAALTVAFTPDSAWTTRPRAAGVDGALGELLAVVAHAAVDGTWRRLKACANDTCRWAFYDHSRARSGRWCSMQLCGNRSKQQAWRARHEDRPEP